MRNNFGMSVRRGSQFVAITVIAQCQKHVFCPKKELKEGLLPTRALIAINMENMFNNLSRHQCRKVLQCIFPHLLTLFDSLYMTGNTVYICRDDSTLDSFLQKEGIV
mmetsp:Transcript_28347/g.41179  ORF Transcript_28347/g.41179 Transcript_28347/m.41179 type:complete len:107 (-) Transcript_28347:2237-2557(-)